MEDSNSNQYKLSKRIRYVSKLLGYESAFKLFGSKKLGEGAFGSVFASKDAAIKISKAQGKKNLEHEIKMLKQVQRIRSAPKMLGSGKGYIAIQKFNGSPLNSKENLDRIKKDTSFADYIFRKTVEAMGALHRRNIAQRDLHAGNIFITDKYEVKILDYGQAQSGYSYAYWETFFGTNNDPRQGAIGLISHLFDKTPSLKAYQKQLERAIKVICKKKGVDPKIALLDYADIEGQEEKETEYFDALHSLSSPPNGDTSDVGTFYTFLDSALRINSRNPLKIKNNFESDIKIGRKIGTQNNFIKTPLLKTKSISNKSVPKAETGGVFGTDLSKYAKPIRKKNKDLSELAVSVLIAYRVFPQTTDGIDAAKRLIAKSDYWLPPSALPPYYDEIESDLMVGKETPGIVAIRMMLKEFYKISTGAEIPKDTTKKQELVQEETEQTFDLKIPPAHYIEGTRARWQPEFESDFDHAVYFAGKSPLPKGAKQREVLEWLKSLGLTFEQIHEHREKVLEKIRETISLPGVEEEYPYVYIDEVEKDFDIDEEDEEDYDEEDIDNLLDMIREDTEEVDETIDESEEDPEEDPEDIPDELDDLLNDIRDTAEEEVNQEDLDYNEILSDLPESLRVELAKRINKNKGATVVDEPKKKPSSYTTNTRLLKDITRNLLAVTGQLEQVNKSLIEQNQLLQTNIDVNISSLEALRAQDDIFATKFDAILNAFEKQYKTSEDAKDQYDSFNKEQQLEQQKRAAGSEIPVDLTSKSSTKKTTNRIQQYYRRKLIRQLYRKAPKKLRGLRTGLRKVQRVPGRISSSGANKITNMLPKKAANFTTNLRTARSAAQGLGGVNRIKGIGRNVPGLRQALAVWEYGDRKAAGQSDVQAVAGVGGALAGAAAGAAIGTALFPGVGTIAGLLIGAAFSAAGAYTGSKVADRLSGAYKNKQYEIGTKETKPGQAILHGTELAIDKDEINNTGILNSTGATLVAATSEFITSLGPAGASVAPLFEQKSAPLIKIFGISPALAQTSVGGSFPSLGSVFNSIERKKSIKPDDEEELSGMEKDLLETQDPQSFADKLLKMLDPQGRFQELLNNVRRPNEIPLTEGGYATFGETGSGSNAEGWVHGHFQNPNSKQELLRDTFPFVRKLLDQGSEVVITGGVDRPLNKDMDDATVREMISKGIDTHSNRTRGYFAVDVSVRKGTRVPFALEDVRDTGGREGVSGMIPGTNTFIGHLTRDSRSGGPAPSTPPTSMPTPQGLGRQGVMGNKDFGATSGVGTAGYLIVPGHASGDGTPGEKELVRKLARNAYENLKQKYPTAPIQYMDPDAMFGDDKDGWEKQKKWYEQRESEGFEILEVHMDASMQSGQGSGRGIIVPHRELNPVERAFAGNFGAYDRRHRSPTDNRNHPDKTQRPLAGPSRGISMVELGNMDPALLRSVQSSTVSKQQLDYLTRPLEESFRIGLNLQQISPPSSSNTPRLQSLQGPDKIEDTKFLIINQQARPQNMQVLGQNNDINFKQYGAGRWISTKEISSNMRKLYMQRLAQ